MKSIRTTLLAPLTVALFFGGILLSMGFGYWETESTKQAAKYASGSFKGAANPADIRGSYSLQDVEDNFGIPVAVLAKAFGAEDRADPAGFKAKDLEGLGIVTADGGEVGTDSVRLFVSRYNGLPYVPEESTRLPAAAVELLKDRLAPADFKAMEKIAADAGSPAAGEAPAESVAVAAAPEIPAAVPAGAGTGTGAGTGSAERSDDPTIVHVESSEDRTIKGKTTFYDLLSWGVKKDQIVAALGMPYSRESATIRDFCTEQGLEFSEYKTALQALIPAP